MKLYQLFEDRYDDREHDKELENTGFWGKAGAGCLILSAKTKRFLIAKRSRSVQEPHTWNVWGGAIDRGLTPEQAVQNEVHEECGYYGRLNLIPLYVFKHPSGFKYYNFLAIVEDEFEPELNWETEAYEWVEWGDWPYPLHFGLAGILHNRQSVDTIKKVLINAQI